MKRRFALSVSNGLLCVAAPVVAASGVSADIEFNRDIRPILSNHCFKCHGADVSNNPVDLRLDRAEDAYAVRRDDQGREIRALVPGNPSASEVWRRITSRDPLTVMPPPDALHQLSDHDKDLLRRWNTQGLAQDSQGFIYVAHTVHRTSPRAEAIVVFDAAGTFVRAFGEEFGGGAHGLRIRREVDGEFLYLCDTARREFLKLTPTGEIVWRKGYPHEAPSYAAEPLKFIPTNIAFAPDGSFYVGDGYGSFRLLHYTRNGEFLREIGTNGSDDGAFNTPHGQWIDTRGPEPRLVVADRGNHRLQVLTLDGRHERTIADDTRLRRPCHFDQRGDLLLCPDLDSQVCLLDRDYRVVAQLGDGQAENGRIGSRRKNARETFTPGKFITPHDAIFLADGNILVAEWITIGRLTLLERI